MTILDVSYELGAIKADLLENRKQHEQIMNILHKMDEKLDKVCIESAITHSKVKTISSIAGIIGGSIAAIITSLVKALAFGR